MKREEIKAIFPDATDEQLGQVMDLHGTDLEKVKSKLTAAEADLKTKKEDFDRLTTEFETLKSENASGEDWKAKFEALQADNVAKEKQAEADRILKEKQENIENRFSAVLGEKKFSHDAIKSDYLKRFGEALESKDYEGKSDADIFHALTKDDASAFTGVNVVRLAGGTNTAAGGKTYSTKAEVMAIKDYNERVQAIANNKALFVKGDN